MTLLGERQKEFLEKYLWENELLDLGCGDRTKFEFLGKKVIGLDIQQFGNVDIVGDLNSRVPIEDESTSCVVAMNVYEHIYNIKNALAETYRILKFGGRVLGSVPFVLGEHQMPHDFHRFTRFELERLFQEAGFRNIEIYELGTQLDTYRTIQLHLFMGLFDEKRSLFLKSVWGLHKLINLVFGRYLITKKTRDVLGFGFIAIKA